MKLIILLVVLLQVWTALCLRCRTRNHENGSCRRNCTTVEGPLNRCGRTNLYCCPQNTSTIASSVDLKFPIHCGNIPVYPTDRVLHKNEVRSDYYSWLASLQYANESFHELCAGSVINSRYVLTTAYCVTQIPNSKTGGLTGVRLGAFDENMHVCDYATESCKVYQEFGIDNITVHSGYSRTHNNVVNDIALIRVDRPIHIRGWLRPICLPFGNNHILEAHEYHLLNETGWGTSVDDNIERRETAASVFNTSYCKRFFSMHDSQICAVQSGENPVKICSGSPIMQEFDRNEMVLIGLSTDIDSKNATFTNIYTRVSSYGDWLNEQMKM